ncbi:MAG: redoxin domain-containing protein [Acidobacteria bacterium]|nr:redoxin domain-containing protein [Acidobacteriota bacterium]
MPARWMKRWLLAAGVYNIVWGVVYGLFPNALFDWAGMARPNYPELWQCIAMIVGVYGIAYAAAAADPYRHWPVVLAGFLGKLFGPIGFLNAALAGRLPWRFGIVNIGNDLIWLVPFFLILRGAWRTYLNEPGGDAASVLDQHRRSIDDLSKDKPVLLVFLRHFGCTFCREALTDLRVQRSRIEGAGVQIALVHMSADAEAFAIFASHGLDDVARFSDPGRGLYQRFELKRGGWRQLFGLRVLLRGARAAIAEGHGLGVLRGDGFQMPGVFLVLNGKIVHAYRHETAASRPDYCKLAAV